MTHTLSFCVILLISPCSGSNVYSPVQKLFKRQVQCSSADDFPCASGDCVDRYEVCDGTRNCRDGSDETIFACKQVSITMCPPILFQCDYGACISEDLHCNGRNDCGDGSDESRCARPSEQQGSAQSIQSTASACNPADGYVQYWQCGNGQCIDLYSLCDGILDCTDQSDETEQVCYQLFKGKCPQEQWRCTYGACLHRSVHCDGHKDCWDGSDEIGCKKPVPDSTSLNNRPSSSETLSDKGCTVPSPAEHREVALYEPNSGRCQSSSCNLSPGQKVPSGAIITVTCKDQGYQLGSLRDNTLISSCNTSYQWFPAIPTCIKLCPQLISETLDLKCWQGPYSDCNRPEVHWLVPGTRITYSCKQFYEQLDASLLTETMCKNSGQWTRPLPTCTPLCGQSGLNSSLVPTIVGGKVSRAGDFPWHTALFIKSKGKWTASCGGTLINTHIVLTAAHCVTTSSGIVPPPMHPEDLMVVLGKYLREWDHTESSEIRVGVQEVIVHNDYRGEFQRFAQDIALLVLKEKLTLNNFVMPACVDYNLKNFEVLFKNTELEGYVREMAIGGNCYFTCGLQSGPWPRKCPISCEIYMLCLQEDLLSKIPGWGNTEECSTSGNNCNSFSPVLKYDRIKIMSYAKCYNITQRTRPALQSKLTPDKICAGDGTISVVQVGDSGGGLTFEFDGLHYVYGIVSTKLSQVVNGKKSFNYAAFTSVPEYMPWLKNEMGKF